MKNTKIYASNSSVSGRKLKETPKISKKTQTKIWEGGKERCEMIIKWQEC